MFKALIGNIISKHIKRKLVKWTIKEEDVSELLDEVKTLLLDADVNYDVVKKFIISIRSKSIGSVIEANDDPQKVLLSIIKSELVEILGKDLKQIDVSSRLTKIMLVGLNGSGKTTSCGKIAYYYKNKLNKKPLLVAIDIYRPAAIEQLRVLAQSSNIDFFEKGQQNPVITVKEALEFGEKNGNDIVIFDTAGRMQTNEELMNELEEVKVKIHPDEILFTADAMSGQDIINVANEFNNRLELTGFVVTKLDTDAKAGAVLSLISLLDVGVKFSGNGEKISNLELFYPERIANRILGLGDILSISEQAKEKVDEEKTKKSFARMMSGKMDLEDLMVQMQQISKVGSMSSIMKMMPNMPKIGENQIGEAENKMRVWDILMKSMTLKERRNPHLFKKQPDRKLRVVKGSGRRMDEINKLLSEWEKAKAKMDEVGKMIRLGKNPFGGMF